MKKRSGDSAGFSELRRQAEEQLRSSGRALPGLDTDRLAHELQVHHIELELQNEELRSIRAELEGSLLRYTEIFEFAPVGYVTLALDATVRDVNHAAAQLLSRPRHELIGQPFDMLVSAGEQALFAELCRAALVSETRERGELSLRRGGGQAFHASLLVAVLARSEPMLLIAFEDITERKLGELQLAEATRRLREADRRKDDFLGVLSHELRNPLAPIRNSLFVLDRLEPTSAGARRSLAVIERQVAHLSRLIDDLTDATRISSGKIELRCSRVDLRELSERALEDHARVFDAAGVAVESELGSEPIWVQADPVRLTQALSNLLGNAAKFTPRGGRVDVRLSVQANSVLLSVRDTGAGIAPDILPRLFEPFFQAEQTLERSASGLGLGLTTARRLAELHGGTLSITSEGLARGAQATLALPLAPAPVRTADAALRPLRRNRRVLVIDDNADLLESLRDALAFGGHSVQVAPDGPSGIELARRFAPEVVLCDIGLPGMDGYEVARAFRADQALRNVYLVALSGYAQSEAIQAAASAGFDVHVTKPPDIERLEQVLSEAPAPGAGPRKLSPPR